MFCFAIMKHRLHHGSLIKQTGDSCSLRPHESFPLRGGFRDGTQLRTLSCTTLLAPDLIKTGTISENEGLPPVFPIVLYNEGKVWKAPQEVAALFAPMPESLSVSIQSPHLEAAISVGMRYVLPSSPGVSFPDGSGDFLLSFLRISNCRKTADIIVTNDANGRAAVIEVKRARTSSEMAALADEARVQIKRKGYDAELEEPPYQQVSLFGIAFYQKRCVIRIENRQGGAQADAATDRSPV